MRIVIPTRGRVEQQTTLSGIPRHMLGHVQLVAPEPEVMRLAARYPLVSVRAQPDPDMRIADKRAWILRELDAEGVERCLMLDDDLFFYVRRDDVPDRLRDAEPEDTARWFAALSARLSPDIPHAGFGPRQGNQNFPTGWHVGRMMLALGYHVPTVVGRCELGRIGTREDMDISLQLLRQGLPNAVCHEFAVGQKSYAAPGGCSEERTIASSDADAHRLAELHPGLVKVVPRDYRGTPRLEVVVQWKRALQQGAQWRAARDDTGRSACGEDGPS